MDFSEDLSIIKFGISPLPLLPLPPPLLVRGCLLRCPQKEDAMSEVASDISAVRLVRPVRVCDSRKTLSAFAHGGKPQDRNAPPTKVLNPKEI